VSLPMTSRRVAIPRLLGITTFAISALGLLAELSAHALAVPPALVGFFSLSYETNLPTWYASVLLFSASAALFAIARDQPEEAPFRRHWQLLGSGFAFMSLDEAIEIHEHAHLLVDPWLETGGVLYFSWVLPAGAVVVALALVFLPFLRALARPLGRRFVVAAALYLGGALLMELPLGAWTELHGTDNLGYGLIDWLEESLELFGAAYFLSTLLGLRVTGAELWASDVTDGSSR